MQEVTTTDLSRFGQSEIEMAATLLEAWKMQGLPQDFANEKVCIMLNLYSGDVFLTNAHHQVAMMNDERLESFYTDSQTGEEGFKEDLSKEALKRLNLT